MQENQKQSSTAYLDIEDVNCVARWFSSQEGLDSGTGYKAVCNIFFVNPKTAFIYGLHGVLDKSDYRELLSRLKAKGCTTILAERKGKLVSKVIDWYLTKGAKYE